VLALGWREAPRETVKATDPDLNRPKELTYRVVIGKDGQPIVQSNMGIFEVIERQRRRRRLASGY